MINNSKKRQIVFIAIMVALSVFRLWYGSELVVSYSSDEGVDNTLQFIKSLNFWQGNWMGDYDENALIKGCFYPMFAGTIFKTGMNYILALQMFWVVACLFTVYCFYPLIENKAVATIVYGLLLLNPMSTSSEAVTTYRSCIYYTVAMVFMSGICGWALRIGEKGTAIFCLTIGSIFYGISANTREDSQWLTLFFMVAVGVYTLFYILFYNKGIVRLIAILLMSVVLSGLPSFLIAAKNKETYGVFLTEDYNSGEFARACGALSRPYSAREDVAHYPIPEDVRMALYELSPSFKELEPYLEGEGSATRWKAFGDGTDYHNGWVTYALRTAAASAGYYKNAPETEEYWRRVADEVNEACDEGKIAARKGHLSGIAAPFSLNYVPDVIRTTVRAMWYGARCEYVTPLLGYVETDYEMIETLEDIFHAPINASYRNENGLLLSDVDLDSQHFHMIVAVNRVYQIIMSAIFPVSIVCLCYCIYAALKIKKVYFNVQLIITLGVFFLFFTRAVMLAYVDVTAYSTVARPLYMNNCYVMCEIFVLLVFCLTRNSRLQMAKK